MFVWCRQEFQVPPSPSWYLAPACLRTLRFRKFCVTEPSVGKGGWLPQAVNCSMNRGSVSWANNEGLGRRQLLACSRRGQKLLIISQDLKYYCLTPDQYTTGHFLLFLYPHVLFSSYLTKLLTSTSLLNLFLPFFQQRKG